MLMKLVFHRDYNTDTVNLNIKLRILFTIEGQIRCIIEVIYMPRKTVVIAYISAGYKGNAVSYNLHLVDTGKDVEIGVISVKFERSQVP